MQDKDAADSLCSRQFGVHHHVCVAGSKLQKGFHIRMAVVFKCLNQQQA